jgi:hypothetical protein
LAVTAEGAERVRVGADRVRVGGGWCCSRNPGAESDSFADQYFRDHSVVLNLHLILFRSKMEKVTLSNEKVNTK